MSGPAVFSPSRARPPLTEHDEQVIDVDFAIFVQILRAAIARPPRPQDQEQIVNVDFAVAVQVSRAGRSRVPPVDEDDDTTE